MTDFTKLTDEEVVNYIDRNFHLFARARSADFPREHLQGLKLRTSCILRWKQGFALVNQSIDASGISADLAFLYVLSDFRGQGIGVNIIEQAKILAAENWWPLRLTCETSQRRGFFEQNGFRVDRYHADYGLYEMSWLSEGMVEPKEK